MSILVVTLW